MENETQNYQNQSFIQWIAPAFRHARRPLSWYLIMGGIILVFILYGLYTQSYLTSITFIIRLTSIRPVVPEPLWRAAVPAG